MWANTDLASCGTKQALSFRELMHPSLLILLYLPSPTSSLLTSYHPLPPSLLTSYHAPPPSLLPSLHPPPPSLLRSLHPPPSLPSLPPQAAERDHYSIAELLVSARPQLVEVRDKRKQLARDLVKSMDDRWEQLLQIKTN